MGQMISCANIHLSWVFLMRQLADLSGTPVAALAGDAVVHHFRRKTNTDQEQK
jgi:hypothetical protein